MAPFGQGIGGQAVKYDGEGMSFETSIFAYGPGAPKEAFQQPKKAPIKEICYDKKNQRVNVIAEARGKKLLSVVSSDKPQTEVQIEYNDPTTGELKQSPFQLTQNEKAYNDMVNLSKNSAAAYDPAKYGKH